jgi:hypothetical protein
MKLAAQAPDGHPNDWPRAERLAFQLMIDLMSQRMSAGEQEIDACHAAAVELGLDGGANHWLVESILANVFGRFYVRSGDFYADAGALLGHGTAGDLNRLGAGTTAWAKRVSGVGQDH